MALPLLRPDSDEASMRRYTYRIVPLWTLFGNVFMAPFYGFNVWLMDVLEEFGFRDSWSPAGATVTTAFTIAALFLGIAAAFTGPWLPRVGARRIYFCGTLVSCCAMLASGVSVEAGSLVGLYLSWGVLYGLSQGAAFLAVLTCCVSWFQKYGKAGHGVGWIGFCIGVWPAVFSFLGPAAVDAVGLAGSFHLCAGVLAVAALLPALFICMPDDVTCAALPTGDKDRVHREDVEISSSRGSPSEGSTAASTTELQPDAETESDAASCTSQSQDVGPMRMGQALLRLDFWILWLQLLLSLMPGFGIQYIISPMMINVFAARESLQVTASFIFLGSYAVGRLFSGFLVGPRVSARNFMRGLFAIQGVACAIIGAALFSVPDGGRDGEPRSGCLTWVFVVLISCIGMTLAGTKVMIPLLSLDMGGAANLGLLTGLMYSSAGTAAVLGPVTSWMALSADRDRPSPVAVAVWFCGSAGITAVAMLLYLTKPLLLRSAK